MVSFTILSLLAGAILGLRFTAYVLVVAICFATAVIAGAGAAVEPTWWIALDIVVGAIGLQLGYIAGSALMSAAASSRLLLA